MKKEKIKQLVDVMQAYVNGKTIQYYKVDLSFKIEHPGKTSCIVPVRGRGATLSVQ